MATSRPLHSDSPLISVLVPTYNAAAFLPTACRSIQAQTYSNFEVVILDDGSTDDSMSVLSPFAKDPRFQILSWKPNRGQIAAWRELIPLARGKYWVSPGADDILLPEFLERRVALMEAHPSCALAHGPIETINERGEHIPNPYSQFDYPVRLDARRALKMLLTSNFIAQPSTMIRCDVTRKVMPFYLSDWQFQDWCLWILILATGGDLLWDNQPLLKYRIHSNSLSYEVSREARRRAEFRLVPLCALKVAAQYSPLAAEEWSQWRPTLYRLWLWRAFKLRLQGALKQEWLEAASEAYCGRRPRHLSLLREFCRHGPGVAFAVLRQFHTIKKQFEGIPIRRHD
jgi:glycosyltransferase involved in cell wall biosynthesis